MEDQDEMAFKKLFGQATALYPGAAAHEASLPAYWSFLRQYSPRVLREAFRRACVASPEFFPSAVKVKECAEAAAKTQASARLAVPPSRQIEGRKEYVPPIGGGAEQWIAEAQNEFERLARMWQVESKELRLDPERDPPPEIGQRRFKEFWALWEKSPEQDRSQTGVKPEQDRSESPESPESSSGEPQAESESESELTW